MSTTLTNGLKLPDKGSVDWYADMQNNYQILDGAVGTIAEHSTQIAGKAPLVHTHTKSDITDLFNSANTWSGEQTFSQTIQGNAATASAFDTAKSITLMGAVTGTVSGTNSWEIATVLKTGTAITGGTVPDPYFKIASWEVAPNRYFGAILQIQNKCYPNNTATLTISVRTKNDATFQRGYSLLNNAIGYSPSEFILCYKEVTGKVLCELYFYTTIPFNGIRFSVISEGIQNDSSLFNMMVVYQSPAGIAALPSDYTVIQTTIGTYTQDFIPYDSNTYDLGTSTKQWNNLYAKNYYYNGVAWGLDKANTWTNTNTFQQNITYERTNFFHQAVNPCYYLKDTELEKGTLATTHHAAYVGNWQDKNSVYLGYIRFVGYSSGRQTAEIRVSNLIKNGALDPTGTEVNCTALLELQPSGEKSLIPEVNNYVNLGTSTNKWKTLNGITPGALSLPDYDKCVDKTSEIPVTSLDGNTEIDINDYFPNLTGWINIVISDTSGNFIRVVQGKAGTATGFNNSRSFHAGSISGGFITLFMPIVAGTWKTMRIQASSVIQFRFYSCFGNV